MNKTELKPCPFCGGKADIKTLDKGFSEENFEYFAKHRLYCKNCGVEFIGESTFDMYRNGGLVYTKDGLKEIMEKWNNRVSNSNC